jgi:ribonuclease R
MDRFSTRFLAERVGAKFTATITGVTRIGLFVRLPDTGAEGLIPIRDFGEYMQHDEHRHRLVGETSGAVHSLGGSVEGTLIEADTVTGSLRFELLEPATARPLGIAVLGLAASPTTQASEPRHDRTRRSVRRTLSLAPQRARPWLA